jgi:hypothetical protein
VKGKRRSLLSSRYCKIIGVHLFKRDEARDIDSGGEVKNQSEAVFDIPLHVAKMISEYRDRILPTIIRNRPKRLFALNCPGGSANVRIGSKRGADETCKAGTHR